MRRARAGFCGTLIVGLITALGGCRPGDFSAAGAQEGDPEGVPTFEFDPTWPKPLPNHWVIGNVIGVSVDSMDHVWIVHRPGSLTNNESKATFDPPADGCCRAAPPVLEFDQEGNLVQAWGGPGQGYEWPQSEHGIFVDYQDNVWIGANGADDAHVLKFTRDGRFLLQIGRLGQNGGSNDTLNLGAPAQMIVDPDTDELYVADGYQNRRIIVFDAQTGAYKRHWGAYGNRPEDAPTTSEDAPTGYDPDAPLSQQFGTPVHCVAVSHDDLVYACDRINNRIQVFREDGTFVDEVRIAPRTLGFGSTFEVGFSPDPAQRFIYVPDGTNEKVWILSREELRIVGSFGHPGHFAGGFTVAHSVGVDSGGNLYIGETLGGKRVQRFLYRGMGEGTD